MTTNALVTARVNQNLKNEASAVLDQMGLTLSDAIRLTLIKIARDKVLPFEIYTPNKKTLKTLEKSERGEEVFNAENINDLFNQLDL